MDILRKLTLPERIAQLEKERREILQLSPEKAFNAILDSSHAVPLVHSFPEQDFYFLIHDIGPEDCLPLLSMASARQWEYILDLEAWDDDRIDLNAVTRWLGLLAKADNARFIQWLLSEKQIFVEYYLFKNIEIRVRDHDEDPSDFGDGFFSLDNVFFIRFLKDSSETSSDAPPVNEEKETLLSTLLDGIAAIDHTTFQKMLLESTAIISAEFEAEAFHLRNARLEEKGFLPFETAIGIYYPLNPAEIEKAGLKCQGAVSLQEEKIRVPMVTMGLLEEAHIFARALQQIDHNETLKALEMEFVSLCNQIIVADRKIIREKQQLSDIVKKACGFIRIGLQAIQGEKENAGSNLSINDIAALICKIPLAHIFRAGYGQAVNLKHRADKWVQSSWFRAQGEALSFWDEQWMGVLGGLLIKRPLYFDNFRKNVIYREFEQIAEIHEVESVLDTIMAADELLARINVDVSRFAGDGLTYKNMLLTMWANDFLGRTADEGALTYDDLKTFFKSLFPNQNNVMSDSGLPLSNRIPLDMKNAMMDWLSRVTGQERFELSRRLASVLEALFLELEDEYGPVAFKDLDPKFILHFRVSDDSRSNEFELF